MRGVGGIQAHGLLDLRYCLQRSPGEIVDAAKHVVRHREIWIERKRKTDLGFGLIEVPLKQRRQPGDAMSTRLVRVVLQRLLRATLCKR